VYTYSSGLERGSPRFTEHGSYFVYVVFLWTSITVSLHAFTSSIVCFRVSTSYICPPSHSITEAVPENEGDYLRNVHSPSFAINQKGCCGL
jgi:hypothetical protein